MPLAKNLKIGDSPDQVIRILDDQRLEHSTLTNEEFISINGHDYGNQNIIQAIKRHTAGSLLWREDIQLVFVFDEKRQLTKFDVIPVYTSF